MMRGRSAKILQLALAFGVTAAFLYLTLRRVDLAEFFAAISRTSAGWILAACAACVLGLTARVTRWWWMLRRTQPDVRYSACFAPLLGCLAINNLLPFRAGDVVRVVAFRERLGVSSSTLLATLAAERVLDAACLLVLLASFLPYLSRSVITPAGQQALVVLAVATIVAGLAALTALRPMRRLVNRLARSERGQRGSVAPRVLAFADGVLASLEDVVTVKNLAALAPMSLAAWIMEGAVFYSIVRALDVPAPAAAAWLAMTLASLSTLIPSTPGYVGPFHYFAMVGLGAFGVAASPAAAVAFLSHGVLYLVIALWGGGLLLATSGSTRWRLGRRAPAPGAGDAAGGCP